MHYAQKSDADIVKNNELLRLNLKNMGHSNKMQV